MLGLGGFKGVKDGQTLTSIFRTKKGGTEIAPHYFKNSQISEGYCPVLFPRLEKEDSQTALSRAETPSTDTQGPRLVGSLGITQERQG